ncbi:MAG: hypothetical protein RL058_1870 [Actinomycetota bacterium]
MSSDATAEPMPVIPPGFTPHPWRPISAARIDADGFIEASWEDGRSFRAYGLWLAENSDGYGLDPVVRESTIDPIDLPVAGGPMTCEVDGDGALTITWGDRTGRIHPGWLRHVADGGHLPDAPLPRPVVWSTDAVTEPPTVDGTNVMTNENVLHEWLSTLMAFGLCRLINTPADPDFLGELMGRIGPIRDSNFGHVWDVRADPVPNSTANTGLGLGQHTDLPTREVPPGFQFLHCIRNEVSGGWSRMTDGLALVAELERNHPEAYEALTTLDWVFMNRAIDADHRWIGPMIDFGGPHQPLTIRAFYPVRTAPHMDEADIPRAYEAMRVFSTVARDPSLQLSYPFKPGDLVGFDNRRVLHGRDPFDSGGTRHLRGCYMDHDDVKSRLRVLARTHHREEAHT